MGLNPAYVQQGSRTLPLAFGYVYCTGDRALSGVTPIDGQEYDLYRLGEGEWDGPQQFVVSNKGHFTNLIKGVPRTIQQSSILHFHSGSYGTKGAPHTLNSIGPEQGFEAWWAKFPSVAPPQNLSGVAYYVCHTLKTTGLGVQPIGIWRALRCRMFDGNGNVVSYGFTTNPTWHFVEAVLRYRIKPQQPSLQGLSAAEKACFDWGAVLANSQRNAAIQSNGKPRFSGNYLFAADATVTNILEVILRCCRSYQRVRGGQIAIIGDDPRASVFTFSQRHVVPNTVKINKKDLSRAANCYVPLYRDLELPAVARVLTIANSTQNNPAITIPVQSTPVCTIATDTTQPFTFLDILTYCGGTNDAQFAGEYQVGNPVADFSIPCVTDTASGGSATGGYIGTQASRFSQRAPTGVQHRAHQKAVALSAPGITSLPRMSQVEFDCGNNTFEATNRLMKNLMIRDLGPDGAAWKAPFKGTISGFLESVDVAGNALLEVENGDRITLDDTASPMFAGDFEVIEMTVLPPSLQGGGSQVDLVLQSYHADSYTEVSDSPLDTYIAMPNQSLTMGDQVPALPYRWALQATPTASVDGGGGIQVVITDLAIQYVGHATPTTYTLLLFSAMTAGALYTLYVDDFTGDAVGASHGVAAGALTYASLPAGRTIVLIGTFTAAPAGGGLGGASPESASTVAFGGAGTTQAIFTPYLRPEGTWGSDAYLG